MRGFWKAGAAAMALCSAAGSSAFAAGTACARPNEISAVQAIAVQQELMVSALSCQDSLARYNQFQTAFHRELLASDKTLMRFMIRLNGAKGEAEYHAYKTRVANTAQLRYIHDPVGFCANAEQAFDTALDPVKPTLAAFASAVPVEDASTYSTCEYRLAIGIFGGTPRNVPLPEPKPVNIVVSAQGAGLKPAK